MDNTRKGRGSRIMQTIIHNYRSGQEIIPANIINDVTQLISSLNYSLGKYEIKNFKDDLSVKLTALGWAGKVLLSTRSNISITAMFKNIGLCAQTGNMARMYADLMKLQALYMDEKIKAAIFVIPTKACANSFGGNIANCERFLNELTNIFSKVITVPMLIIGFDNKGDQ